MSVESKITRKEFYEKLSRKSGSEATPANAQTALNNNELYCQHEYKKSIEDSFVSLNEDVRKIKKEEREEKRFQRENERRKIKGLKLLDKSETPPEDEKINNDPYLIESAHIITDFISLSIG